MTNVKECSYNFACSYMEQLANGKEIIVLPSANNARIGFKVNNRTIGVYDNRNFKLYTRV